METSNNGCFYTGVFLSILSIVFLIIAILSSYTDFLFNMFWVIGITIAIFLLFYCITKGYSNENSILKKRLESLSADNDSDEIKIIRAHMQYLRDKKKPSACYDTTLTATETEHTAYQHFCDAFADCLTMSAIWQVEQQKTYTTIKKPLSWCLATNRPYILPNPTPAIDTLQQGPIYFYPHFALHYVTNVNYEVWYYDQLDLSVEHTIGMEIEGQVPSDSECIDKTWLHTTKDGSPDLRYSYNPTLYSLKYGVVRLETPMGILVYYASRYNGLVELETAFEELKNPNKTKVCDTIEYANNSVSGNVSPESHTIITHSYFDDLTEVVRNLYNFICKQAERVIMQIIIEESDIEIDLGTGVLKDPKEILLTLTYIDLIGGHMRMGHVINTRKAQALGVFLFHYMQNCDGETVPYKRIAQIDDNLYQSENNIVYNGIIQNLAKQPQKDTLFLTVPIMRKCRQDVFDEYKVKMYRYFSVASKGDATVSNDESAFLSSIMSLPYKLSPHNNDGTMLTQKQTTDAVMDIPTTDPMSALNELVGLDAVKKEIETLTNFIKIQQLRIQKGLKTSSVSYHCIFTGNPGTGKTTVARIVASIYKDLGVLKKGHLVETDRAGLVAEYVGQTAVKTNKKIDEALDGVLFIDEAYSLIGKGQDYGKEAIATLLKRMEDERERLVVILAGYSDEMKQFIDSNPGLQSRFNRYIEFSDYSANELMQIFDFNIKKYDYTITPPARNALQDFFDQAIASKDKNFGNARFVRNIFEKTLECQANRLAAIGNLTTDKLSIIDVEDLPLNNE